MDKEFMEKFAPKSVPALDEELEKARAEAILALQDAQTSGFVLICVNDEGRAVQRHHANVAALLVAEKMVGALAVAKLFHTKE